MAKLMATPRARTLGFGLRAARKARNLGVRELARLAEVAAQDLSHWEKGIRVPSPAQLGILLGFLKVGVVERNRLLALAATAQEADWLESTVPGSALGISAYIAYERSASTIFNWESALVPGLLQTEDYARLALRAGRRSPLEVEERLRARMSRREVLGGRWRLPYEVLIAESVLRGRLGGDEVMVPQLEHLHSMAQRPNITVRVLPDSDEFHAGLHGAFVSFDFPDLPPIVYLEQYLSSAYLYSEGQATEYRAAQRAMATLALTERDTHALLREVILDRGGSCLPERVRQ
ncbi:helix-turn-helix transcriptional regulator [Amycolatopsis sp. Hca4]|uniref:helix-turn-helix domain-containing protein n=1 Tax=Amycolatopsis sp. Hca4 TaxID=2742131 RepID=UPI00159054AC|nr:helix-turn-helix transcriptional regulator [Amycolatopsis sp. Hca4]QKV77841.1 helix-turn-helix transcriptional regulator [Amycolatopsis sp. Hca4]